MKKGEECLGVLPLNNLALSNLALNNLDVMYAHDGGQL